MVGFCAADEMLVWVEHSLFFDELGGDGIGYEEQVALGRLEDLSVCIDAVNVAEVLERVVDGALMEFDGHIVSSGVGGVEAFETIWSQERFIDREYIVGICLYC